MRSLESVVSSLFSQLSSSDMNVAASSSNAVVAAVTVVAGAAAAAAASSQSNKPSVRSLTHSCRSKVIMQKLSKFWMVIEY